MSSLSPSCKKVQPTPQGQQVPATTACGRRVSAGVKLLVGSISLAIITTGCAVPHVASMATSKPTAKASAHATKKPTPSASPTASATVAATKVSATTTGVAGGDLSDGSVTHYLDAGSRKLVVNYWIDQDPAQWTATRSTIINLAAHIENGDTSHAVLVSDFNATLDDGTSVTTLDDDKGAFTITPPYAYSTGLVVRAHPGATSATVILKYDLLVQTAPGFMAYFRQTVIDTVHINFATSGAN